jgi:hypothetical protein
MSELGNDQAVDSTIPTKENYETSWDTTQLKSPPTVVTCLDMRLVNIKSEHGGADDN